MNRSRRGFGLSFGALLALAALNFGCTKGAAAFHAIDITGVAGYKTDLQLLDSQGQKRGLQDFHGKVVILFFGYVQCPDVCPTTLLQIASIRKELDQQQNGLGKKIQSIFVTVDPERDVPEVLSAYVSSFDPDAIALRPKDSAELELATKGFKIFYQYNKNDKDDGLLARKGANEKTASAPKAPTKNYTVDHTAAAFVLDQNGQLRLFVRYGMETEKFKADLLQLLRPT